MSVESFCPQHGPYDAALGACPYCSGKPMRPSDPGRLADMDDLPTDLGPNRLAYAPNDNGALTEIPAAKARRGFLDIEEDEETQLGRLARDDMTELDIRPTETLGMLWVKEGTRRGKFYPIKHGVTIGRKESDLLMDDPKVSSIHAKFTMEDEDFIIWDFGSANGTYVNGRKIRQATRLNENDLIRIGDTVFVIKLLEPGAKKKPGVKKPRQKKLPK